MLCPIVRGLYCSVEDMILLIGVQKAYLLLSFIEFVLFSDSFEIILLFGVGSYFVT